MTPITKEMSDEKKDEMISQALRAPENAVLVQNLLDRGMTESDLLGRAELREAAEQSPKEIKERVREFLERLNAELPQAKAEQAPSEREPLEKTSGHEQAPSERERPGMRHEHRTAEAEKKKKDSKT